MRAFAFNFVDLIFHALCFYSKYFKFNMYCQEEWNEPCWTKDFFQGKKKRHMLSYMNFSLVLWFCNKLKNELLTSSISTQIPFLYYQCVSSATAQKKKQARRKANTYFIPPRYLIIAEQYAAKGAWPVSASFQLVWHCTEKTELENCTSRCILKWL